MLAGAGLVAGTMNAVAGGGSFVSFPALVFAGVPAVAANASSTVALWPGSLTSAWAYRDRLSGLGGVSLPMLIAVSLAGGLAGAVLLLLTPEAAFNALVPWLLLIATLAFAFGGRIGAALRRRFTIGMMPLLCLQFLIAVYGGYFGGAVGIMMLALWSILSEADLRVLNPTKVVVVSAANSIATLCFVLSGEVWWRESLAMLVGGAVGGYIGAHIGRRLKPIQIRVVVTVVTVGMTAVFFARQL